MKRFNELGIAAPKKGFVGNKIKVSKILGKEIKVEHFKIEPSNYPDTGTGDRLCLQLEIDGEPRITFSGSAFLMDMIKKVPEDGFPFLTTIKEINEHHEFT